MAAKFLSPGVFTTELDQSFLAQGVAGIGAVLIGRTTKGPAMVPTFVQGYDDFADRFGPIDPLLQMPYAARNYLKNSTALTVVRVLGHKDGSSTVETGPLYSSGWVLPYITGISDSGSNGQILAEIHSEFPVTVLGVAGDANNFVVQVTGSQGLKFAATASFLTASSNYIGKVLNLDPTRYSGSGIPNNGLYHYVFRVFKYAIPAASASWTAVAKTGSTSYLRDFEEGRTQYVKSQPLGGVEFSMFRFHTRGHGLAESKRLKVVVRNIKPSPNPLVTAYGTFDVIVRDFADSDQRQTIFESFIGVTLDPSSKNYILKRIGDMVESFDTTQRKFVSQGVWKAQSKLIWVELDPSSSPPPEALPWGFFGYPKEAYDAGSSVVPNMPLVQVQKDRFGNIDPNVVWGIQFISGGIEDRMKPFADGDETGGFVNSDPDFSLNFLSSSVSAGRTVLGYNTSLTPSQYWLPQYNQAGNQQFAMPFRGGHDGWDIRVTDPLFLQNADDETLLGVVSLKRAVDTIANPDAFDMNLLGIPAVNCLKVVDYARLTVNNRQDAMYVMDITGASVSEAVGQLGGRQIDDNYTACYYPDLRLNDTTNNKIVRVAPSVAVMGAIAFSDRVSQPWFAPAGLNRGGLAQFDIIDVVDRLTFDDRNTLYDNKINPIATFPDSGIVVFGQKTLQAKPSALDRVNVRRLLIFAKKTIASAAKYLVFEPDNPVTWQRFTNLVNPILAKVQQDQGLNRFKVVMDSNTNTPDVVDRNIMVGKIFLEPTKAAEFIDLQFIITSAGVQFGQ